MKNLIREPLFHFLFFGALLFGLYAWVSDPDEDGQTIVISDYDMENLIASWEMQWKRLPTDEELKRLVDQNIKQEIFYQEALKMNLDHNDEIIKRRLAQKMQFLSNDLAKLRQPTEEEIQAFYQAHKKNYMSQEIYTFEQVIFSPDQRANPREDALEQLAKINPRQKEQAPDMGDELPFPRSFKGLSAPEVRRTFGSDFEDQLKKSETGSWLGPINSGYGVHLVFIEEFVDRKERPFEEIREAVLRDMEYERQREQEEEIYRAYRQQYSIEYDLNPEKFDAAFVEFLGESSKANP